MLKAIRDFTQRPPEALFRATTKVDNYLAVLSERWRLDQARRDLHRQIASAAEEMRRWQ